MGIKIEAAGLVTRKDFRHLLYLQEVLGPRFLRGVVLYLGTETVAFGNNLHAAPVEILAGEEQPGS